jgi:hypothetical protein
MRVCVCAFPSGGESSSSRFTLTMAVVASQPPAQTTCSSLPPFLILPSPAFFLLSILFPSIFSPPSYFLPLFFVLFSFVPVLSFSHLPFYILFNAVPFRYVFLSIHLPSIFFCPAFRLYYHLFSVLVLFISFLPFFSPPFSIHLFSICFLFIKFATSFAQFYTYNF